MLGAAGAFPLLGKHGQIGANVGEQFRRDRVRGGCTAGAHQARLDLFRSVGESGACIIRGQATRRQRREVGLDRDRP